MNISVIFNLLLLGWLICCIVASVTISVLGMRRAERLNDRLAQSGEKRRNWMNPENVMRYKSMLLRIAPEEYKSFFRVYVFFGGVCVVLIVLLQIIFFCSTIFF